MSGIDKICKKIISDADEKAAENIRNAEIKAAEFIAGEERKAVEDREKKLQKAMDEAKNMKERIISIEELESRKHKLKLKQDIITRVFDLALERLAELPDKQYRKLVIEMTLPLIKDGNEEIVISGNDRKRLDGIDTDINRCLCESGMKGSVTLSGEEGNFLGGFILKRGRMEINNTLETMIKTKREDLEKTVAEILFD